MGPEFRAHSRSRKAPLLLAASLAVIASASAVAAQPTAASTEGLMQFEHVRVVNAPIAATATTAPQAGMRAYVDPDTGELRGPTAEEMQAAAAEQPAAPSQRSLRAAPMRTVAPQSGGVGMALDESFMQYSMVVRQSDGSLAEICVTGPDNAIQAMKNAAGLKAVKHEESTHDR